MKQIITFLILTLSSFSFSQDWQQDKENLKGNVKYLGFNSTIYHGEDERNWEIINQRFYYNTNGYLVKSTYFFNNDAAGYYHGTYRIYNDAGNQCLEQYFIIKNDTMLNCQLEYDSLNRMIKGVVIRDGRYCSTCTYLKFEDGSIRKCYPTYIDANDTIWDIFEYDQLERMVRNEHNASTFITTKSWKYDERNNVIEEKSEILKAPPTTTYIMNGVGSVKEKITEEVGLTDDRNYKIIHSYDTNNRIIRSVKKQLDNRILEEVTFTYNQHDDAIVENHLKSESEVESIYTVVYEYDVYFNWIKKTTYKNEIIFREEERQIEYY